MKHIAADGDDQIFDLPFGTADGERVEKCLCGVFVRAVTSVDHRTANFLCEQGSSASRSVTDNQYIRLHGVQRHRGIDERFAFLDRRIADRHIHNVGAEPFSGQLERRLRSCRCFEEEIDLRATAQDGLFFSGCLETATS